MKKNNAWTKNLTSDCGPRKKQIGNSFILSNNVKVWQYVNFSFLRNFQFFFRFSGSRMLKIVIFPKFSVGIFSGYVLRNPGIGN